MRRAVLIPARMQSTRLPGKPLADIAGRPLIAHVVELGLRCELGPVIVAAAEESIADAAQRAGAIAVLTDPELPSGTDRIWQALCRIGRAADFDVIVNLQGDTPTIRPESVRAATQLLESDPAIAIATLVSRASGSADRDNPAVVKVVLAPHGTVQAGRALYFSRAAVPFGAAEIHRHIGLYVYRRDALATFVASGPTQLELCESLEQLRALELGLRIDAAVIAEFPKGIDTAEDLAQLRAAFASPAS